MSAAQSNVPAPVQRGGASMELDGFRQFPFEHKMRQMAEFAVGICNAVFVPQSIRGNPASVFFCLATGDDMGLRWTHAIRSSWMTPDGKIGFQGDQILALLLAKGFKVEFPESTATKATCRITRPGTETPFERSFTWEEASKYKASYDREKQRWKMLTDKLNYQNNPTDMLMWRSFMKCARFAAADVVGGLYIPDELEDIEAERQFNSSMGEPTEADRERAAVLEQQENGGMGSFKVGVKPGKVTPIKAETAATPDPKPEPQPKTVDVKAEHVPIIQFWIQAVMQTAGGGHKHVPLDDEMPQTNLDVTKLRARALANDKGITHVVVKTIDGGSPEEVAVCNPPAKPQPPAQQPATEPQKPAAAPDPAPAAKTPSPDKQALLGRLNALAILLTDDHDKPIAAKTAMARFNSFFAGFLSKTVKELPKDPGAYGEAIESLEGVLTQDCNEFRAGPDQCGARCRERNREIGEYMAKQTPNRPEIIQVAQRLAAKRNHDLNGFTRWYEGCGLDFVSAQDAYDLMRLHMRTREAGRLFKIAKDHNLSLSFIVKQIEDRAANGDLNSVSEQTLNNAILGFIDATKAEAAKPKPKPTADADDFSGPPPPPAADGLEDDQSSGGLFGDL